MGIFTKLLKSKRPKATYQGPYSVGSQRYGEYISSLIGSQGHSHSVVNESTALNLSAVWACVLTVSQDLSILPAEIRKQITPKDSDPVIDHPSENCITFYANEHTSAQVFRETITSHAITYGNGFAWIERDGRFNAVGNTVGLHIITPDRVRVEWYKDPKDNTLDLFYYVRIGDYSNAGTEEIMLRPHEIFHIPGFGFNGIMGYPLIQYAARAVGLGADLQQWAEKFFSNGSQSAGYVTMPEGMEVDQVMDLKKQMEMYNDGMDNAHRLKFLFDGVTYQPSTINPEAAQFLQSRGFQLTEMCRFFRVAPNKIGYYEGMNNSNFEHTNKDHYTNAIYPWVKRFADEYKRKIFVKPSEKKHYVHFDPHILIQADTDTQGKFIRSMVLSGIMTPDEGRARIGLDPLPDGEGEKRLVPVNVSSDGESSDENANENFDKKQDADERVND